MIRIEPWAEGDLPLLEKLLGDPAMTEHLGGPEPLKKIAERQERYERLTDPEAGAMFKIVDGESGEGVGSVGYWERELPEMTVYETGWSVLPAFQGRGIATVATAQCIEQARGAAEAQVPARVPGGREPRVERDLPQARLRAARRVRVRVPEGQRQHDELQRLAARSLRRELTLVTRCVTLCDIHGTHADLPTSR